jgi:hypothetical protein
MLVKVDNGKCSAMSAHTMQRGKVVRLAFQVFEGEYLAVVQGQGEVKACQLLSSVAADPGSARLDWPGLLYGLCRASAESSTQVHSYKGGTVTRTSGVFAGYYFYLYNNKDDILTLH